jgi:hypothetical protein
MELTERVIAMLTQSWGALRARAANCRAVTHTPSPSSQPSESDAALALARCVADAETKLALAISYARVRGISIAECAQVASLREELADQRTALDAVRSGEPTLKPVTESLPNAGRIALGGFTAGTLALYHRMNRAA